MATLRIGSRGPQVRALKDALVAKGYFVGDLDDHYDEKCAAAVAYLQSCHGLHIDAIAGPQVHQMLDIGQAAGAVEMTLPPPDSRISRTDYDIEVNASTEADVRVLVLFRVGAEEVRAEANVHVPANGNATATIPIPESVRDTEGEVAVTAYAYLVSDPARVIDQKPSHFWVDRP